MRRVPLGDRLRAYGRALRFVLYMVWTRVRFGLQLRLGADLLTLQHTAKLRVSRRILRILGVTPYWAGALPPKRGPRLIVANHRAALDIGVLMTRFGGVFLSRADLERWPIIGTLARQGETIFVDRADRNSGARAIRAIRRRLGEGHTVIVFPEGTTYRGDEVRPFLAGAFAAARGLDVEVVPVGLAYPPGTEYVDTDFVSHVRGVAARPQTPVCVQIGAPFAMEGRAGEVAAEAREAVQALVEKARARLEAVATTPDLERRGRLPRRALRSE